MKSHAINVSSVAPVFDRRRTSLALSRVVPPVANRRYGSRAAENFS